MVAMRSPEAEPLVPLESGDRLTREEFHRRYLCRPDIKKAELIEGVVYVASPVSLNQGKPHYQVHYWLGAYSFNTPGVEGSTDTTLLLTGGESEPQPDVFLYWDEAHGGTLKENPEGMFEGACDLAVETAASSASYDLHDKKRVYARSGVQEYIIWQVYEKRIDWWRLRGDAYVPLVADERGVIDSEVFPGLRLNIAAMLAGDMAAVLAELG